MEIPALSVSSSSSPPSPFLFSPCWSQCAARKGPFLLLVSSALLAFRRRGGTYPSGEAAATSGGTVGGVFVRSSSVVPHDFVMRWQLLYGLPCVVLPVGMASPSPPLRLVNIHT